MQNSLLMTPLYLLLSTIKMKVPMLLAMTSPQSQNRLSIGKYFLIQIHTNLLKKFRFQGKRKYRFILP